MVRAPDSRLGGLWFSSIRFKVWTISFTPLCLCLSEEILKNRRSLQYGIYSNGSKISYTGKVEMEQTCRGLSNYKEGKPLLS